MADTFNIKLVIRDWIALDERAKELGFKNFRSAVPGLLSKFKEEFADDMNYIDCKDKRRKANFDIPEDLEEFYNTLACKNNSSTSGAIFRYIILPMLICNREIKPVVPDAPCSNPQPSS